MDSRLPRTGCRGAPNHETGLANSDAASSSSGASKVARQVNALDVYEDAVQEPLLECSNLAGMYYQAQDIGSTRPEARVLREDFCSSAIVAQTWLGLDKGNRAQGVDIDLDALMVARRRAQLGRREDRRVRLLQSAVYSAEGRVAYLAEDGEHERMDIANEALDHQVSEGDIDQGKASSSESGSTWAHGAASDRFERKFQAKLAREKLKKAPREDSNKSSAQASSSPRHGARHMSRDDREHLLLIHADVLALPLPEVSVEAPDVVYAGNYALSYFHDRRSLLAYLGQCRRTLRKGTGVLVVDPFAGPTSWDPSTRAERDEQEQLWSRFSKEPGFLRLGNGSDPPPSLQDHALQFWHPSAPSAVDGNVESSSSADWRKWPRGRLVLVRKGRVRRRRKEGQNGSVEEYEYWREDGPLDYATNRFRMSLSFRFSSDGSWLRDYFSYDFRVWSLKEITEAMEEVGFTRVGVHALPRTTQAEEDEGTASSNSEAGSESASYHRSDANGADEQHGNAADDDDLGLEGMADLMRRTEHNERNKCTYQVLESGQKLFASKSFASEQVI